MADRSRQYFDSLCLGIGTALLALVVAAAYSLPAHQQYMVVANILLSAIGFFAASWTIESPGLQLMFIKAGLKGIDLNKATTERDMKTNQVKRPIVGISIPESQGVVIATVYILVLSIFIPFAFTGFGKPSSTRVQGDRDPEWLSLMSGLQSRLSAKEIDQLTGLWSARGEPSGSYFPSHEILSEYLAVALSVGLAAFMGFADDVLNLRWRHKIHLPFLANLPLLLVYHVSGGLTGLAVPNQLRWVLGGAEYIELSFLFYIYLLVLVGGSTQSINIYAGVNGLEVGQAVVIAVAVCCLNSIQILRAAENPDRWDMYRSNHVQSLVLMLPFLATSVALLRVNWFPSRVFVGDTYAYFAGAALAAVSIVGHFSKTMLLLLIPQIANALYSLPQVLRLIPCPRHRMPTFRLSSGNIIPSYCEFVPARLSFLGRLVFRAICSLRLADVSQPDPSTDMVRMSNLTLINLMLVNFGPCQEDVLCLRLLSIQAGCAALAFIVRFIIAGCFYDAVL